MYARPRSIEEAVAAMAVPGALPLGGGTDVFPAHAGRPVTRPVVDLTGVEALRGIWRKDGAVRIGAATRWTDIVQAELPAAFDGLKQAAREIGSIQIQNRGTIAGNLCNASPAADGIPPLLTLDAAVELRSARGMRVLPLADFVTGYRKTALAAGEIVTAVLVPAPAPGGRAAFVKLGARRYLVISILMAAALVESDEAGIITRAAVAVGAASPVALRLTELEQDLKGWSLASPPSSVVSARHLAALSPIDDVRATAGYRSAASLAVLGQALDRAAGVA